MPLVMMCGHPCSGKTRAAQELAQFLASYNPSSSSSDESNAVQETKSSSAPAASASGSSSVVVVNEESLKVNRNEVYAGRQASS